MTWSDPYGVQHIIPADIRIPLGNDGRPLKYDDKGVEFLKWALGKEAETLKRYLNG